jgi:hypothetical protein
LNRNGNGNGNVNVNRIICVCVCVYVYGKEGPIIRKEGKKAGRQEGL